MDHEFAGNPWLARTARWAPKFTDKPPPGMGFEDIPQIAQVYPSLSVMGPTRATTREMRHGTAAKPGNYLLPKAGADLDHHKEPIPSQHPSQYYDTEEHGDLTEPRRSTQAFFMYESQQLTDEELQALTTFPMNQAQQTTDEDRRLVVQTDSRTRSMIRSLGINYNADSDQFPDPTEDALCRPPPSIYGPGLLPTGNDVKLPKVQTASPWTGSSDEGLKRRFRAHLSATAKAKRQDVEIERKTKDESKEYRLHGGFARAGWNKPSAHKTQPLGSTWNVPRAEAARQNKDGEYMHEDGEHRTRNNGLRAASYAEMAARRPENRENVRSRQLLGRAQDVPSWNQANVRGARNAPGAEDVARPNRFPRLEASEHVSPETLGFFERYDPRGSGLRPDNRGCSHRRPPLEPESSGEEAESRIEKPDSPGEELDSSQKEGERLGDERGDPGEEGKPVVESRFKRLSDADLLRYLESLL